MKVTVALGNKLFRGGGYLRAPREGSREGLASAARTALRLGGFGAHKSNERRQPKKPPALEGSRKGALALPGTEDQPPSPAVVPPGLSVSHVMYAMPTSKFLSAVPLLVPTWKCRL